MGEKNCYVVRLNAIVDDPSLDPLLEDGTATFRLFTNPITNESVLHANVYTRPLGAFEMKVLGAMPTLLNPTGTPESIENGYIYKVTAAMSSTWGGFEIDNTSANSVRVNVKEEEVANLGYVYSSDIDLSLIGDAYLIQLSNPSIIPQKYHKGMSGNGITIAQLSLADKHNLTNLRCNYAWGDGGDGFVTGTTAQIAAAATTGLENLEDLELYGNKNFTGDIANLAVLPKLQTLYLMNCGTTGSIENFVKAIINAGTNSDNELYIGSNPGLAVTWQGYAWNDPHWIYDLTQNVLYTQISKKLVWSVSGSTATIQIFAEDGTPLSPNEEDYTTTINLD